MSVWEPGFRSSPVTAPAWTQAQWESQFAPGSGGMMNLAPAVPPGYITGTTGTQGSSATGFIPPGVPDPTQSAIDATKGNLVNMENLRNLYGQIANTYVPGYAGLSGQESSNIARLLNPPRLDPRYIAETGSALGIAGAPAASEIGYRMTDRDWRDNVLAGSNMLNAAAGRGRGIYDLTGAMVTPAAVQAAREEANIFANAPNPAAAHNLAMQDAQMGIRAGAGSQRGGGTPATGTGNVGGATDIAEMVRRIMEKYAPKTGATATATTSQSQPFNMNEYMFNSPDWYFGENGWDQQPGVANYAANIEVPDVYPSYPGNNPDEWQFNPYETGLA